MADSVSDKEALELWKGPAESRPQSVSDQEALELWNSGPAGEAGAPGFDPYAGGPNARVDTSPTVPQGTLADAAKSFANKAALGAGPIIAGGIGALANAATQGFADKPTSDLDAYRAVRDDSARELESSENTTAGQAVTPLALIATPVPVKGLGPGASVGQKALQGAKVGGGA